jgi:ParB/RepB/Spo0J family partition protein
MSEARLEVKMLSLDEIRPNPFQPRESFPKEEIQQLADTIKEVGLLQPITVRKKGKTYQIISGERRWRACQFAGLKEIPAIIKDISDSQLMIESLIENVQRTDLEPLEKARGLAEIYRLSVGFEPTKAATRLHMISRKLEEPGKYRELTEEEKEVKEVADMIGLSYDYQYRLLSQLRLSPEEQKRVTELKLGYEKIASLSSIEGEEDRRKLIEIAPTLERAKVKTVAKIVKKAPKPVKEAVLKKEIEPEIAEEILKVEEPKIQKQAFEIAKKGVYTKEGFQTRLLQLTKPRIELPQESVDVQIFNKTMWNLERVGDFDFYTIGYEKKTIEQFLRLLEAKKIGTLVDVRKNPVSQYKPEFSKENLKGILSKNGIRYVHYPELGVPSEIRRKLGETGDYNWFFKQYDKNVIPKLDEVDLENLGYPIAIMCVELDPTKCHRHRIALALEKKGLRGYDL